MSRKNEAADAYFLSVLMDCHGNRSGGRRDGCSAKEREASQRKISLFGGCICISWNAGKLQWGNESLEKATCTRRSIPFIYLMGTLLFQLGRNPAFGPVTFTGRIHCTAVSAWKWLKRSNIISDGTMLSYCSDNIHSKCEWFEQNKLSVDKQWKQQQLGFYRF